MQDLHIAKSKTFLKDLPDSPGVYLFKNTSGDVIYIGKAKNLKSRVSSYFLLNLATKTAKMIMDASFLSFIVVNSEFEALILEAKLVQERKPKYNIQLKDDKSPLYIVITKEEFPRVISLRKTQLQLVKPRKIYGPFLEGVTVRKVLRMIRKIVPYSTHIPGKRVCIYKELGLCDPCPSERNADRKKYLQNIKNINGILSGQILKVKRQLEKQIQTEAKKENFEEAQKIQNQIRNLDYVTTSTTDPNLYEANPNLIEDIREREKNELRQILLKYFNLDKLERIECFDIAHLAGSHPTASMVTFEDGVPNKNYYRHFKVKIEKRQSDVDSMKSILKRRINHFEGWGIPDLIIIDGGKPQVSAALEVLSDFNIPVIGLAKRFETIVIMHQGKFVETRARGSALNLLQRIRDEAHRFARHLHHKSIHAMIKG